MCQTAPPPSQIRGARFTLYCRLAAINKSHFWLHSFWRFLPLHFSFICVRLPLELALKLGFSSVWTFFGLWSIHCRQHLRLLASNRQAASRTGYGLDEPPFLARFKPRVFLLITQLWKSFPITLATIEE